MAKTASLLAATLAALCLCPPAYALSNRAWVSGHGADASGCGSPASPCRSFQYVHDNIIAAGGEIDVLDPAGYGAVTISKALSIANDGVGTAGVQQGASGQNAITINAGASDNVTLRGLSLDGLGTGGDGVLFNTGARLTVSNCVIRNFLGAGIYINPTTAMTFFISDTTVSDNGGAGVDIEGSASVAGTISRAVTNRDNWGVFQGINASTVIAIVDSVAANNAFVGYYIQKGQATLNRVTATGSNVGIDVETSGNTVFVSDSTASDNVDEGLANDTGVVVITRFVATGNGTGLSTEFGTVYTYGDNRIIQNGTNISGTLTPATGN